MEARERRERTQYAMRTLFQLGDSVLNERRSWPSDHRS